MLGIDNSKPLIAWPAAGVIVEFDFGECYRSVEVIRGKHKDVSGLMCVDVKVTDTIWDQGVAFDAEDFYTWEIEQYDSYVKQNQADHDALAG